MKKSFLLFCVSLLFLLPVSLFAAEWPQFMGPERNAISPETDIARSWPDDGPNVLWSIDVGDGFGAAAIKDEKVYILDRIGTEQDVLRCLNFQTGDEIWRYAYDAPGRLSYDGSRSVPTVDDEKVYTVGPFGHVLCLDRKTHNPLWTKHLHKDFGGFPPNWGFSQSPMLHGDMVIVAPMSDDAGLVALNKESGELIWKCPSLGGDAYSTPRITTIDGVPQVILMTKGLLSGVDLQSGKRLWQYDDYFTKIPIPNATPLGDGQLFVTGGYNGGSTVIQVSKSGSDWNIKEISRHEGHGAQVHEAILYEGHLYANLNTNENLRRNPDGLACMDLKGNIIWQTKGNPDINRGSLLIVDDLIFVMGGDDGILHLIEANPKQFNELDSAKIFEPSGREIWAPMALSNGKLIVRNQSVMKCLDIKNP